MLPASRTPEGSPNRCPICGNAVIIEPSMPAGDAPCPYCNSLLWFDHNVPPQELSYEVMQKTRQQIPTLSSEIAALANEDLSREEFFEGFLQRVVQAMAAVGGAVWLLKRRKRWPLGIFQRRKLQLVCQINLSDRFSDDQSEEMRMHRRLLDHAIVSNTDLVVPPYSALAERQSCGNPTPQLLLVSPLHSANKTAIGVVEIFQRPNAAAAQRGYSQFLRQVCEYGSVFLARSKEVRRAKVATAVK
jgi:hypothetical protein